MGGQGGARKASTASLSLTRACCVQGVRNEPATVPLGVAAIAKVKGLSEEDAAAAIRQNFQTLFKR